MTGLRSQPSSEPVPGCMGLGPLTSRALTDPGSPFPLPPLAFPTVGAKDPRPWASASLEVPRDLSFGGQGHRASEF